jgi:hypothetical protein
MHPQYQCSHFGLKHSLVTEFSYLEVLMENCNRVAIVFFHCIFIFVGEHERILKVLQIQVHCNIIAVNL